MAPTVPLLSAAQHTDQERTFVDRAVSAASFGGVAAGHEEQRDRFLVDRRDFRNLIKKFEKTKTFEEEDLKTAIADVEAFTRKLISAHAKRVHDLMEKYNNQTSKEKEDFEQLRSELHMLEAFLFKPSRGTLVSSWRMGWKRPREWTLPRWTRPRWTCPRFSCKTVSDAWMKERLPFEISWPNMRYILQTYALMMAMVMLVAIFVGGMMSLFLFVMSNIHDESPVAADSRWTAAWIVFFLPSLIFVGSLCIFNSVTLLQGQAHGVSFARCRALFLAALLKVKAIKCCGCCGWRRWSNLDRKEKETYFQTACWLTDVWFMEAFTLALVILSIVGVAYKEFYTERTSNFDLLFSLATYTWGAPMLVALVWAFLTIVVYISCDLFIAKNDGIRNVANAAQMAMRAYDIRPGMMKRSWRAMFQWMDKDLEALLKVDGVLCGTTREFRTQCCDKRLLLGGVLCLGLAACWLVACTSSPLWIGMMVLAWITAALVALAITLKRAFPEMLKPPFWIVFVVFVVTFGFFFRVQLAWIGMNATTVKLTGVRAWITAWIGMHATTVKLTGLLAWITAALLALAYTLKRAFPEMLKPPFWIIVFVVFVVTFGFFFSAFQSGFTEHPIKVPLANHGDGAWVWENLDFGERLHKKTRPAYPACLMRWGAHQEIRILDLAILSSYVYDEKNTSYEQGGSVWEATDATFTGQNLTARILMAQDYYKVGRVVVFRFTSEGSESGTTVLVVKGSSNPFDFYADAGLWSMIVAFQMNMVIVPLLDQLPNQIFAYLLNHLPRTSIETEIFRNIRELHDNYTKQYPDDAFVITGHSLGGGIATAAGGSLGIHAIAFSGPGSHFSRWRFNTTMERAYRSALDIKPENDLVHKVDRHDEIGQYIDCRDARGEKRDSAKCHSITTTVCELWRSCGDYRGRDFKEMCHKLWNASDLKKGQYLRNGH